MSPREILLIGHQVISQPLAAVAEFVHQKIIAHQQCVLHRFRWNLEGLHNECDYEDRNHDCAHQRLQGTDQIASEIRCRAARGGYGLNRLGRSRTRWIRINNYDGRILRGQIRRFHWRRREVV